MRVITVRLSTSAALCAVLAGCVSSDPSALGLAENTSPQPLATPQLAVVAGDPAITGQPPQSADPNTLAVTSQGHAGIQTANTPQLSPLKRQSAQATPANSSTELAITDQVTSVDPAVQQVANIAESATSTSGQEVSTQQNNEIAATEQPALIAAIPPTPPKVKKPNLLERLFGSRAKTEEPAPASQPVLASVQEPAQNPDLTQNASGSVEQAVASANGTETQVESVPTETGQNNETAAQASPADTTETTPSVDGASSEQPAVVAALPANSQSTKEPSVLQRLFGNNSAATRTRSSNLDDRFASAPSGSRSEDSVGRSNLRNRFAEPKPKTKSKIKTISRDANGNVLSQSTGDRAALPGVKSNNEIFGIEEDPQVKENKANTQLAALGNLGRLSPKGLRLQHDKVQVACLKPGVLHILNTVERKYGKKPIITSGYRSPKRNRRAGGARNSQHVFCKAVDIQVEGVSKWQLAKYLRSIPGRGGVGTYCRTKSVHIDIGKKRDWHHKCRRSAKRKRKKA